MEQLINYYQDQAEQCLTAMHKAMQQYEATQESKWLNISLIWEARAQCYLALAEYILEAI